MEDREIMALFESRSETAIDQLTIKYAPYGIAIAERIVGNRADAEECLNDAYLRVWDTIPPQKPRSLKAYLGTIVRRLALNRYKAQHTLKREGDRVAVALSELEECLPSTESADAVTEDLVIRDCLHRFLDDLSNRDRQVFIRRYWYLEEVPEIAAHFDLEENHVYVLLSRMRKILKSMLQKEGISL